MTNEQAIKRLKHLTFEPTVDELDEEALDMAIEALQRGLENVNADSCSEKPNRSDTIYRQDVIDMIQGVPISSGITKAMLIFRAKELPSAQPDLLEDGTIMMTIPHGMLGDVKRVMVDEVGTKFCKVMYQDEPERKKGEWIIDKDCEGKSRMVTCNRCGHNEFNWHNPNFCPNCGAEMG